MSRSRLARRRAPALLRWALVLALPLLVVGLGPGPVHASGPRNMDVPVATAASRVGEPGGTTAAAPADGATAAAAPRVVYHGPRTGRVVALTFDDGYAPGNVKRIFEELKKENVPATFFVNGAYMRWDPALWRAIAAAGFPIGNHTVIHEDVRGKAPAHVIADLERNATIVEQVIGRPMIPLFRPPYGDHDAVSDAAAAAAGFPTIVLWDVVGGDADLGATDASVLANASAGLPGSIVLLHAGPSVTPRILPALIARYRARGFTFVTVPELLGMTTPGASGPTPAGPIPSADPAGAAAPTPPAVLPSGDDRGALSPAGAAPAVTADPSPSPPARGMTAVSSVTVPGGAGTGSTIVASPGAGPGAPGASGAAGPASAVAPSLARDAAWARGPARDAIVAGATVTLLAALLLLAAIAGRRARLGN
jgi:peptidoglycan/xylan/chitin deacetylase (PgdA/CDA1 family)